MSIIATVRSLRFVRNAYIEGNNGVFVVLAEMSQKSSTSLSHSNITGAVCSDLFHVEIQKLSHYELSKSNTAVGCLFH